MKPTYYKILNLSLKNIVRNIQKEKILKNKLINNKKINRLGNNKSINFEKEHIHLETID